MAKDSEAQQRNAESVTSSPATGSGAVAQSSSQEVAKLNAQVGDIQARQEQSMATFMDWIVSKATTNDEDQYAIMASIIDEILQSDSPEEVLRERSALHARDITNTPLLVHGFEIRAGDYEESTINHYAALTVSRQGSAETRVITCGGIKVMAKLMKLDQFGEWPQIIIFTEKKTSNGYGVLDIVKPAI